MESKDRYRIKIADESMLDKIIEFDRDISWEFADKRYINSYDEFTSNHRELFLFLHNLPGKEAFIIAEKDTGEIIGLSWVKETWDTVNYVKQGYIYDLEVSKDHRSRGLGKLLLEKSIIFARSIGLRKIALRVELDNTYAIKFYLKQGFKPTAMILEKKLG
jgi:ribosomal protein S18 acetylase RimI-like enzyme